jgi:hypothetical protein
MSFKIKNTIQIANHNCYYYIKFDVLRGQIAIIISLLIKCSLNIFKALKSPLNAFNGKRLTPAAYIKK